MTEERLSTPGGRLARLGFADSAVAERHLRTLGSCPDEVVLELAASADPDQALLNLSRLVERAGDRELVAALSDDPDLRVRLTRVLGASDALGQHLVRHPDHWRDLADGSLSHLRPSQAGLRSELLAAVAAADGPAPVATEPEERATDALRVAYRRLLLRLAARDLVDDLAVDDTAAELADLAGATLEAALAIARASLGPGGPPCRLAVIGMGKCGGRELNYVSDVDVVFVAEPVDGADERPALAYGARLAAAMMRICSAHTPEGTLWPVDAGLRPEGGAGPLVRTLASHLSYYERWAKTWEFQALLKARPVAGDVELGRRFVERVGPMVWQAADRPDFVAEVQAMRRRVVEQIPTSAADRELKLGPGGLRDVEFAVQLLQLVHGRADETLRRSDTLSALRALTEGGYVGRDDGAELASAYRFLRLLEHRIQLQSLRRTHVVPDGERDLRRLGRSLGMLADPVGELRQTWRHHSLTVMRLHQKLFYRPLLDAVARLPGEERRLSPAAARERLTALGYLDPRSALHHLEALTAGVSRRAAIQRTLLPVMLDWFAGGPDPDAGLLAFRQVSEQLGGTHWYLKLLRDEGAVAERLARVVSASRYLTGILLRAPETVAMLADDDELRPRSRDQLVAEMTAAADRHDDPGAATLAVRSLRRRELWRIGTADLLGLLEVDFVGEALTDLAVATIEGALRAAESVVRTERRGPLPTRVAVVAMGRFGGHELGYGSDADVMFVHDPLPGASAEEAGDAAFSLVQELRRMLALPGADPPLDLDADLRPEGRQGPLVRTLASYESYYGRWSAPWEAQALLRADPLAGDPQLCRRFASLVDPLRWPSGGLDDAGVREIRRVKARVDAERLPRGADPTTHLKLGRGGLADIEWTVQLLQLRHAGKVPALRVTRTLPALHAAAEAGLVSPGDASELAEAWRLASRIRNAVMLVRGRPSDSLPRDPRERAAVAHVCGYPPGSAERLVQDYLRAARRARAVVDRVFWE